MLFLQLMKFLINLLSDISLMHSSPDHPIWLTNFILWYTSIYVRIFFKAFIFYFKLNLFIYFVFYNFFWIAIKINKILFNFLKISLCTLYFWVYILICSYVCYFFFFNLIWLFHFVHKYMFLLHGFSTCLYCSPHSKFLQPT